MQKNKFKNGFTLLEMLVYVTLIAVVGFILVDFILNISFAYNRSKVKREVLSEARLAMDRMLQDIRAANAVYAPTSQFDIPVGHLSLVTIVNLPSGEEITYLDYFVSSSRLWLKAEGQAAQAVTSERVIVTGLTLHRFYNASPTAEAVQVQLAVESQATRADLQASTTLQSTGTLRGGYLQQ